PDKPSIAVLPFVNMSGDPKQEYFSDGITEEIITALSKTPKLFVIARNSTFTYKGKPVKMQQVGRELGVKYVLEGSVRKSGDKVRITAQLVDAQTGHHLWAERYDRDLKDIFAVQDEITLKILNSLQVKLAESEQARVWAKGTNNLEAYLKFLKAYDYFKSFSKTNMILARQICEEAIAQDPTYGNPYALIGTTHLIDLWFGWADRSSMEKSQGALKKAITLDPQSDFAHANLGDLYLLQRRFDEAVSAGETSVTLNPNGDYNMVLLGITFNHVRRYEEAIRLFKEANRRNPFGPAWYIHNLGLSYSGLKRFDEAIAEYKRALDRNPDHFPALVCLAGAYGSAGKLEEGRAVAAKVLKINPGYSVERQGLPFKYKEDAQAARERLLRVGIPEKSPRK
ncbi:MAG: tetratricopeptide repeat protein, partial [Desulfobacteraceae bacterium]